MTHPATALHNHDRFTSECLLLLVEYTTAPPGPSRARAAREASEHALGRGKPPAGPAGAEDGGGGHHHSTSFKTSPRFYASDITALFSRVCGGLPCTVSDRSTWDKLENAVIAQWGDTSPEYDVWLEQGAYYGVDDHGAADGDP